MLRFLLVGLNCQLHTVQSHPRRETPLRNCLDKIDLWACLWWMVLIVNWCWRAQPAVGTTIPQKVSPSLYKEARWAWAHEQAESEPTSDVPLGFLLHTPSWVPALTTLCECDLEVEPLELFPVWVFYRSNRKETRTESVYRSISDQGEAQKKWNAEDRNGPLVWFADCEPAAWTHMWPEPGEGLGRPRMLPCSNCCGVDKHSGHTTHQSL